MQLPARLGKYELQQYLGGGMSHVYRAVDTMIGRTVALKILTSEGAQDSDARDRFLDEARTAAKTTHENVISIYDFGVDPEMGYFMVMEFLEGEDLRSAIKNGHTGDVKTKLSIALQAARALEFVHRNRVIHRDVKPENLHVTPNGVVKLMDFGIAKSEDLSRTQPGFALGTPYYMAPEQVRGERVTPQADVYAFGILLFELFTGQRPFVAESVNLIFSQILSAPLNTEPLVRAGAPQPVVDLIARCTAKNATERPNGMTPVIAAIESLLAPTSPKNPVVPTSEQATVTLPPFQPKRRIGPLLLAIGGVLLAIAMIVYITGRPGTQTVDTAKKKSEPELATTLETPTGLMMLVPAGQFKLGKDKQSTYLPAFYIDQTEVTNAAYRRFCEETGHKLPAGFPKGRPDYPVVNITIDDAHDFARWAGKRLPSAAEWEKAARGTDGRAFPWGEQKDSSRANVGTGKLTPVGDYQPGASPYGGLQLIGNVWELVDQIRPAPEHPDPAFKSIKPPVRPDEPWYMIRGQSAKEYLLDNVIWDSYAVPERWTDPFIGFRCAKDAR